MISLDSSFLCQRLLSHCWQRALVQSWLLCLRRVPFSLAVIIGKLDVRSILICTNRQHAVRNGIVHTKNRHCQAPSDFEKHVPSAVAVIREQNLYEAKEDMQARTSRGLVSAPNSAGKLVT